MLRRGLGIAALLGALVALGAPSVHAKPRSQADALFTEGVDHMLAGRFESGCPLIRQSYDLEPLHGALFTLAECYRKWGKGVTAYPLYRDFLAKIERIAPELRERQSDHLTVASEQVAALRGELGTELPLEPGKHVITLELPGQPERAFEEELEPGEVKTLTLTVAAPHPAGGGTDPGRHRAAATAAVESLPPARRRWARVASARAV